MQKLKDLVKRKKLDNKFKKLGDGHQLGGGGPSPPPQQHQHHYHHASRSMGSPHQQRRSVSPGSQQRRSDAEKIAAAAEKRMQGKQQSDAGLTPMQKMVRMQAKKELEEEQRQLAQQKQPKEDGFSQQQPNQRRTHEDASTLRYTCEIFDDDTALPKSEMYSAIENALYEHMADEPVNASVWLIHTFCRDEERRSAALDTIRRYVQNIIDNPTDQKFLQIRLSNKVFADRVLPVKGAIEFLTAIGFREQTRGAAGAGGQQSDERYLVMTTPPATEADVTALRDTLTALLDGKPIAIRVFRDPKVFRIDPNQQQLPVPEIPPDFFKRTVDEIRREQQRMTEELEQMMTLRTKKMREADTMRKDGNNPFKYSYIRVRFPNHFMLQGIFNVYEKFATVREFVAQHLSIQHGTFTLTTAFANQQQEQLREEEHTLLDYGLAPSALIYFQWDAQTQASFAQGGHPISYLKSELESSAQLLY